MDKINELAGWFLKVIHFFDGFGDFLLSIILVSTAFALFYMLIPKWFRMALKVTTIMAIVNLISLWLKSKF
jgi:hypothetical protein